MNENQIKDLLPGDTSSFQMILVHWKNLTNLLNTKGIEKIQTFLNIIFDKLFDLLKKTNQMDTPGKRNNFENEINKIINDTLNNKEELSKNYLNFNKDYMNIDVNSIKFLLEESNSPLKYNENEYPYLKYFMIEKQESKKLFKDTLQQIPNNEYNFPIINAILDEEITSNIYILQNFFLINPFVNKIIDIYNYQISREDAKRIKIRDELNKLNNENLNKMFENFKEGFNELRNYEKKVKFGCRQLMDVKEINNNSYLAEVLNDNGELYFGMIIAGMYELFTNWQNNFIKKITDNLMEDTLKIKILN